MSKLEELEEVLALQEIILARYKENLGDRGPAEANYYHQKAKVEALRAEIAAMKQAMTRTDGQAGPGACAAGSIPADRD